MNLQSRGIATLPGGVPLYKTVKDANGKDVPFPVSKSFNLVGGIGSSFLVNTATRHTSRALSMLH